MNAKPTKTTGHGAARPRSEPLAPFLLTTINGGSSSIKFALFGTGASLRRVLDGKTERIGVRHDRQLAKDSQTSLQYLKTCPRELRKNMKQVMAFSLR